MAVNDIFKKVPVEIPNKSGFDMSHEHLFTAQVGTLVPAMVDMLLPNDTISLGVNSEIQLPPMATDFYGRVKAHYEAFFVPFRILYAGWQDLITHSTTNDAWISSFANPHYLPSLQMDSQDMTPGSLSDYLGYGFQKLASTSGVNTTIEVKNPLKYIAYHKIWQEFYRDARLQSPAFIPQAYVSGTAVSNDFVYLPYMSNVSGTSTPSTVPHVITNPTCYDGVKASALRQRCFGKDYFTNATTVPQAGTPASVAFGVNNNQGAFTIASLRAANALQTWMERLNVSGYRYGDSIRAQFGVYPTDAVLDRPVYLGRQIVDVYNKSVFQNDGDTQSSNTNNPFASVGAKYGSPLGVGSGSLVDNFTATEHGYIFVMFSLVPDAIYGDIIDKDFDYNSMADFPFPLLAGVGDEAITAAELVGYATATQAGYNAAKAQVFGYTQRYANHKFKLDRCSGLLKDGQTLSPFALKRSVAPGTPVANVGISGSFIEIPTNYLDEVAAVNGDVSKYGCWVDAYFPYHKVSTLPAYSIPTLGEPKNTHTEVVENGGVRL